jgi:hypothetical protein
MRFIENSEGDRLSKRKGAKIEAWITYVPGHMESLVEKRVKRYGLDLSNPRVGPSGGPFLGYDWLTDPGHLEYKREMEDRSDLPFKKIEYRRDIYFDGTDFRSFLKDLKNGEFRDKDRELVSFSLRRIPGKFRNRFVDVSRPAPRGKGECAIFGDKYIFAKAFNKYFGRKILSNSKFRLVPERYNAPKGKKYIEPPGYFIISTINQAAREAGLFEGTLRSEIWFEEYLNMLVDYFCTAPASKI